MIPIFSNNNFIFLTKYYLGKNPQMRNELHGIRNAFPLNLRLPIFNLETFKFRGYSITIPKMKKKEVHIHFDETKKKEREITIVKPMNKTYDVLIYCTIINSLHNSNNIFIKFWKKYIYIIKFWISDYP